MDWTTLSPAEKEACRIMAYESLIGFTRVMYRFVLFTKFQVNWHHEDIAGALEDCYFGRCKRMIINLAPGGTKTDLVAVMFIAWTIYREYERARVHRIKTGEKMPCATRTLPVSYSGDLVGKNTGRIKEILLAEPFQYMCPVRLGDVRKGESDWRVTDPEGGTHETFGVSLLGQVTGNRAGFLRKGYSGALIIDDPMPPRDERSFAKKDQINRNMNRVLRNRLQHDDVPIIMIQQRISTGDQTDFLMGENSLDDYRLLKIPALITPEYASTLPPARRAHMIAATGYTGDPVSYWETQVSTEYLKRVQENDPFLFSSQYQQAPDEAMLEGAIFRMEIERAYADDRIGEVPIDKSIPVDTYWDIGYNDMMTIWLVQARRNMRRCIACYGNSANNVDGEPSIELYANWLHDFREKFGIRYGKHHGPHDLAQHNAMSGMSNKNAAKRSGINFERPVERPKTKQVPIDMTRRIFNVIEIDEERCSMDALDPNEKQRDRWGLAGLKRFRRMYDAENEVFAREPVHDWASHWANAFMLIGLTYKEALVHQEPESRPITSGWSM